MPSKEWTESAFATIYPQRVPPPGVRERALALPENHRTSHWHSQVVMEELQGLPNQLSGAVRSIPGLESVPTVRMIGELSG